MKPLSHNRNSVHSKEDLTPMILNPGQLSSSPVYDNNNDVITFCDCEGGVVEEEDTSRKVSFRKVVIVILFMLLFGCVLYTVVVLHTGDAPAFRRIMSSSSHLTQDLHETELELREVIEDIKVIKQNMRILMRDKSISINYEFSPLLF